MFISELVTIFHSAYKMHEFDRVKCELVTRDTDLKALVGPLKEESELQRFTRIASEIKQKGKEKQCEIRKKAKESYESLLRKIKSNGLVGQNLVWELKTKALECEDFELKALKRK
ncbi:hypothetical protein RJT34_28563 [Clitoria ternatea]|uniref:Uncharacterized protein n=1 Tax=Clitoria ternatea TaxID=43366 RepID=A0AAN9IH03_CLITE